MLLLAFISVCVFSPSAVSSRPLFSDAYDPAIERSVARWWPAFPFWRAWKAQLYQESLLEPDAISPAGAEGIAQFMPATWREVTAALKWGLVSPRDARLAIEAGAFYMARLRQGWSSPRPELERQRLAQASYNAGFGNILEAQRRCGGARDWHAIAPCLPQVTGRHAAETITYVDRIARWWQMLEAAR
jgi:membrane-bound lytic murein transglycosylase MltF